MPDLVYRPGFTGGRFVHAEVIDHDQRGRQPVNPALDESERFETRPAGRLCPLPDGGDRGAAGMVWISLSIWISLSNGHGRLVVVGLSA